MTERVIKSVWFYLARINCDCAAYNHQWLRPSHSGEWPRCIYCKRHLGDMQVEHLGKFKAKSIGEAWAMYRESKKQQPKRKLCGLL